MSSSARENTRSQKIKLENIAYCEGCPFLFFNEAESTPSAYIGEGCYKHFCNLFAEDLGHYLHYPLRLKQCKRTKIKGAEKE